MKSGKARTIAQNDDEYVADTQRDQREAGLGRNLRSDKDWQKPLKKPQGRNHKNGYTRGGGQLPQHWFDMPEAIRQDCLMTVFQGFVQVSAGVARRAAHAHCCFSRSLAGNFTLRLTATQTTAAIFCHVPNCFQLRSLSSVNVFNPNASARCHSRRLHGAVLPVLGDDQRRLFSQ